MHRVWTALQLNWKRSYRSPHTVQLNSKELIDPHMQRMLNSIYRCDFLWRRKKPSSRRPNDLVHSDTIIQLSRHNSQNRQSGKIIIYFVNYSTKLSQINNKHLRINENLPNYLKQIWNQCIWKLQHIRPKFKQINSNRLLYT